MLSEPLYNIKNTIKHEKIFLFLKIVNINKKNIKNVFLDDV